VGVALEPIVRLAEACAGQVVLGESPCGPHAEGERHKGAARRSRCAGPPTPRQAPYGPCATRPRQPPPTAVLPVSPRPCQPR
jgi:hypothetical protein